MIVVVMWYQSIQLHTVLFQPLWPHQSSIEHQECMIKWGGGRACNFRRFCTGKNNPPVLLIYFIEHLFAREILITWHDPVCVRERVYVPYSSYNGKFWMC